MKVDEKTRIESQKTSFEVTSTLYYSRLQLLVIFILLLLLVVVVVLYSVICVYFS